MKRNIFWVVWGIACLVMVIILGTKNFAAEASLAVVTKNDKKTVYLSDEQYKVIKSLINEKNR